MCWWYELLPISLLQLVSLGNSIMIPFNFSFVLVYEFLVLSRADAENIKVITAIVENEFMDPLMEQVAVTSLKPSTWLNTTLEKAKKPISCFLF